MDKELDQRINETSYQKWLQEQDMKTKEEYQRLNKMMESEVVRKNNESWIKKCSYIDQKIGWTRSSEL